MPGKRPYSTGEKDKGKVAQKTNFQEIDRGGNGDCLFRAVLDHFLPEATDHQLQILSVVLRRLVAEEERKLALDSETLKQKLLTTANNLKMQGKELESSYYVARAIDPNYNRYELLERADKIAQEGKYAEEPEIAVLSHLLNVNILVMHVGYNGNIPTIGFNAKIYNRNNLLFDDNNLVDTIRIQAQGNQHYISLRNQNPQPLTAAQETNKIRLLNLMLDNFYDPDTANRITHQDITEVTNMLLDTINNIRHAANLVQPKNKKMRFSKESNTNNTEEELDKKLQEQQDFEFAMKIASEQKEEAISSNSKSSF